MQSPGHTQPCLLGGNLRPPTAPTTRLPAASITDHSPHSVPSVPQTAGQHRLPPQQGEPPIHPASFVLSPATAGLVGWPNEEPHLPTPPFSTALACLVAVSLPQLASIGCPNEESYRRELREMLFTSPGIENYISGVVSFSVFFFKF